MTAAIEGPSPHRQLPPVATALHNPDLRRALGAYLASVVTEWALWSGLLVYAYEKGGRTTAGVVSICLFVPGALMAPITGSAADGPRPNRVLVGVYMVQALALSLAASAAFLDWPLLTVIIPATVALTAISFIRPCLSVVLPGLVDFAGELTAANLLAGYCDSSSVLAGPLIASALIALDGPPLVLAVTAALALLGMIATLPLIRLDGRASDTRLAHHSGARTRALANGLRALSQRSGALALLAVIGGQYLMIGALDLIFVVLATEQFGLSSSGPGVLAASFGLGALLGGLASTVLVGRKRLAPLLLASLAAMAISLAVVTTVPVLAVALLFFPVAGLGRTVLDLTGRMLMQRAAPQETLASIFATMESLSLTACALGSIMTQITIAVAGVRSALMVVSVALTVLLLVTARRLLLVDASADAPVVAIRLLRRLPVFAPLPGPALEGVARAAQLVRLCAGADVVRKGDRGDSYFAIVNGELEVTSDGRVLRTMGRGEGFGEIALLSDVARTATVTCITDVDLLEIERSAFLTAVTGHDASRQAAWNVARSWTGDPEAT